MYVVSPRECAKRCHYWLLLAAAYGLVNAGAKWQMVSDALLRNIGFTQHRYMPQLFYILKNGKLEMLCAKIVDDVLFAGPGNATEQIINRIQQEYKLGTVVYGPGSFYFYGLLVNQTEDWSISIHAGEKLNAIEGHILSRNRRKDIDEYLNAIELSAFRSVNSKIGWLGISASPFCALYASYLQQKSPTPTIRDMITQINCLRYLKKLGTCISFVTPQVQCEMKLSVVVFADASRSGDHGQLSYLSCLLFGDLQKDSIVHTLSWTSHKSKRPVKSVGAAETLAAGEAIDE